MPGRHKDKGRLKSEVQVGEQGDNGGEPDSEESGNLYQVLQTGLADSPMESSKIREATLEETSVKGTAAKHKHRCTKNWSSFLHIWN